MMMTNNSYLMTERTGRFAFTTHTGNNYSRSSNSNNNNNNNNNNMLSTRSDHGLNHRRSFHSPQRGGDAVAGVSAEGTRRNSSSGPYNNNFSGGSYHHRRSNNNQNDPLGMHSWHQGSSNAYFNKNFDKRRHNNGDDSLGGNGVAGGSLGGGSFHQYTKTASGNKSVTDTQQQQQQFQHSYKKPVMPGRQEYLAIDCEVVGTVTGESVAARVVLIDWKGRTVLDTYVNPAEIADVTDYRTPTSGITPEMLADAPPFHQVRTQLQTLMQDKIIVGHTVDRSLRAFNLEHPYLNTRDTAYYQPFMQEKQRTGSGGSSSSSSSIKAMPPIVGAGSAAEQQASPVHYVPRNMAELAKDKLQREIQLPNQPRCPIENAMAALDLYKSHRPRWEACITTLQQKAKKQALREQRHALRELQTQSQHGTGQYRYPSQMGQTRLGQQQQQPYQQQPQQLNHRTTAALGGITRNKSDDLSSMSMHSYFYQPKRPVSVSPTSGISSSSSMLPPPGFGPPASNNGASNNLDLLSLASTSTNTTTTANQYVVTGLDESFSLNSSNHSFSSHSFHHPAVPAENPWSSGDEMDNPLSVSIGNRNKKNCHDHMNTSTTDEEDFAASLLLPSFVNETVIGNKNNAGGSPLACGLSSSLHSTSSTGYNHWSSPTAIPSTTATTSSSQPTTDLIIGLKELGMGKSPPHCNPSLLHGAGYNPAKLYSDNASSSNNNKTNGNPNRRSLLSSLHGGSSTTSSTNSSSSSLGLDVQSFHDTPSATIAAVNSILSASVPSGHGGGDDGNDIF